MLKKILGKVTTWFRDWVGHSATLRSEGRSISPLALIPQALTLLAGLFADKIAGLVVGPLPPEAAFTLRILFAVLLLGIANFVITAKTTVTDPAAKVFRDASPSGTRSKYKYTENDRLLAKLVILLFLLVSVVSLWPRTGPCRMLAEIDLLTPTVGGPKPLLLEVRTQAGPRRYSMTLREKVAFEVAGEHRSSWSLVIIWSDEKISGLGAFSGCPSDAMGSSEDGIVEFRLHSD